MDLEVQEQINNENYKATGAQTMDIILYNASDIQRIFKCGRKKAYEIMHIKGFPTFRIDTSLYVEKSELEKWIARNKNKNITT